MKNIMLFALLAYSAFSRADLFCAFGDTKPTSLNHLPYATMQVDDFKDNKVQITITSFYESIQNEVQMAEQTSENKMMKNYTTQSGKKVIISRAENVITVSYDGVTYTCDQL